MPAFATVQLTFTFAAPSSRMLGFGVIVLAIGLHLALWGLLKIDVGTPPPATPMAQLNQPVAPSGPTATAVAVTDRVYMMPSDWQALQAQQEATLHSYGWVDRQAGVVHIPIDQAIDLVLQRGLPVRGQP